MGSGPAVAQEIIAFGDSLTQGVPIVTEPGNGRRVGGYPVELERLRDARVYNYGDGGEGTPDGLQRLYDVIRDRFASVILILMGTNDIDYGLSHDDTITNLRHMINISRLNNLEPVIATIIPDYSDGGAEKNLPALNQLIRQSAQDKGVRLADLYSAFLGRQDLYQPDGKHLTPAGYHWMAVIFNNALNAPAPAPPAPIVETGEAANIQNFSAQIQGDVLPNGAVTTYYFEFGLDTNYGMQTDAFDIAAGWQEVAVSAQLQGLAQQTTYHYRLVAESSSGITFGADRTFTTSQDFALTLDATGAGGRIAILNGRVRTFGADASFYFQYGTSLAYGIQTPVRTVSADTPETLVSEDLIELSADTIYHFRLVVVTAEGTFFGADLIFATGLGSFPTVTTLAPYSVKSTSAVLSGSINPNGFAVFYYFEYGETEAYGNVGPTLLLEGSFNAIAVEFELEGLNREFIYHYRLVVLNEFGTIFGADQGFITASGGGGGGGCFISTLLNQQ